MVYSHIPHRRDSEAKTSNNNTHWFYESANGEQRGPVPAKRLRWMAEKGDLSPDTLVWRSGMKEWERAGDQTWFPEQVLFAPPSLPDHPRERRNGNRPPTAQVDDWSRLRGRQAHRNAFIAAFFGGGILAFLGPGWSYWSRRWREDDGTEDLFVKHHAIEAINFNLSIFLYYVGATIFSLLLTIFVMPFTASLFTTANSRAIAVLVTAIIGLLSFIGLVVFWLIFTLRAYFKARDGEWYRYPLRIPIFSGKHANK